MHEKLHTAQIQETQHVMAGMLADVALLARVAAAADACIKAFSNGGKVLLAGNGGSALMRSTSQVNSSTVLLLTGPACRRLH